MGMLRELRLMYFPLRLEDPDFGRITYQFIRVNPPGSYWEGRWLFPPTGTEVEVTLPGSASGPRAEARAFYLGLASRFETVVASLRPSLGAILNEWMDEPVPADLFSVVKLSGFEISDLDSTPIQWEILFETTGGKWLGIAIPFVGDQAGVAKVVMS